MSTTLYLRCLSHTPNITSWSDVGHNTSFLPEVREWLRMRRTLVAAWDIMQERSHIDSSANDRFQSAMWFLSDHPSCEIDIQDEYGHTHPAVEPRDESEDDAKPKGLHPQQEGSGEERMKITNNKTMVCQPKELTVSAMMDFCLGLDESLILNVHILQPDSPGGVSQVTVKTVEPFPRTS